MRLIILALITFNLFAQGKAPIGIPKTELVTDKITFQDDINFENMQLAINRHLSYFNRTTTLNTKFKLGGQDYIREDLKKSLERFSKIVLNTQLCIMDLPKDICMSVFSNTVNAEFDTYKSLPKVKESGYATGEAKYTAYYSPKLQGSRVKTQKFKHAIYGMPKDAKLRSSTREQIQFEGKLEGKGLELFYVSDSLYDIWLLHVEGGGVVEVLQEDGTKKRHYISYAGTNKQNFSMLYRYMVDKGYIEQTARGINSQREFIKNNPDKEREIISSCKSYIYFKETVTEPLGVKGIPLTMNRSLATDKRLFGEYGLLTYVAINSKKESSSSIQVNRFFINQDTGGYIRGAARADLYMGYGAKAEFYANNVNHLGKQYFIVLKK